MTKYKYSDEELAAAVEKSYSYANVLRLLGIKQAGGSQTHIKKRIDRLGLNVEHFTGMAHNKGKPDRKRKTASEILVVGEPLGYRVRTLQLRRALIDIGREVICGECGIADTYNGKPITLEIDHINGNAWDNREENLRFLCPNCHSQQDTNTPWKNTK